MALACGMLFATGAKTRITEPMSLIFGALFGGSLFGRLHSLAWKSRFPTPGEATCIPVVSLGSSQDQIHGMTGKRDLEARERL